MVVITLGVLYLIFILRQVFCCELTVEAIYNTTHIRIKKKKNIILTSSRSWNFLQTHSLPITTLAEPSIWGGHGRKTARSAIHPPPTYRRVSRSIQAQAASRSNSQIAEPDS
jgi:hypothetical protein